MFIVVLVFSIFFFLLEWIFTGKTTHTNGITTSFISWYDNNVMEPATKNFL